MKILAALLLFAACDLHRMQEQPRCEHDGTTTLLPHDACDLAPPDESVPMTSPEPDPPVTRALLLRGRDRFERICGACHGVAADGVSQVARAMTQRKPPSLVDAAAASLSNAKILAAIASGYGVMPPLADILAPADRFAVLHYVRALQRRDVPLDTLTTAEREEATRWLR